MVVVGVTHNDGFKGAAAARAEREKHEHYNNHKKKCRNEGNLDARLDVELIPLALEVTGEVGREVKELGKDLKQEYETRVLPVSNTSAAAALTTRGCIEFRPLSNDARLRSCMGLPKGKRRR